MRNLSQKITADRLDRSLRRRGVTLKRHQLVEILAETFGLVDSNDLAAAVARGEIDPPAAEALGETAATHPRLGTLPLVLLRDPTGGGVFALDPAKAGRDRADRFVVTPYGGLLVLPDLSATGRLPSATPKAPAIPAAAPPAAPDDLFERHRSPRLVDGVLAPDQRNIRLVPDSDPLSAVFEPYGHLIGDESFDTGTGPLTYLNPNVLALVDGEPFLGFSFDEEYDDHGQAKSLLRDLRAFSAERGETIARAGGILRWEEVLDDSRVDVEILLPARLADRMESSSEWEDAVLALISSPEGRTCKARFHPQAWSGDRAVDVDPEGPTTFDVAFEVSVMGRETAAAVVDSRESSDALRDAVAAPRWIREWTGPYRIEVQDEIQAMLAHRDDCDAWAAIREAGWSLRNRIGARAREGGADVARLAALLDDGHEALGDAVDDVVQDLKGSFGADVANQLDDRLSGTVLDGAAKWVTENVSNAAGATRIGAVLHALGVDEGMRLLERAAARAEAADGDDAPRPGDAAAMPDGETAVVVARTVGRAGDHAWTVEDANGDRHDVERDGSSWHVVVPSI